MPLEIPILYDSEKIEKFGKLLLKIGKVILYLVLILGIIYCGYKYYLSKDIFFAFLTGFLLGILFKSIYKKYKKKK